MAQPWTRDRRPGVPGTPVELHHGFTLTRRPPGPLYLAIEQPERWEVRLNDRDIATDAECGWWVDPAIRLVPLDEARLKRGRNELVLAAEMDEELTFETCFLLGDFAVEVQGHETRIAGPMPQVAFGDWTDQGLPFYGGSVIWRTELAFECADGDRMYVEVPRFAGACVRVLVDGCEAGIIGWQPHEVDITKYAGDGGTVELAVEVISHRRNCFGPLHHVEARPDRVGPDSFVTVEEEWRDAYNLVPAGCLEAPQLSIRRQR
jgi:hypothetical protein